MIDTIGIRILVSSIAVSILVPAILLIKIYFKKHISLRVHYHIWFLLLILLGLPFLPLKSLEWNQLSFHLTNLGLGLGAQRNAADPTSRLNKVHSAGNWMKDFSISIEGQRMVSLTAMLVTLWAIGACFMLFLTIRSHVKIGNLIHSSLPVQNQKINELFYKSKNKIGLHKKITLYSSAYIPSPISTGIIKPCIILPISMILDLKEQDIRFILLHELSHYRQKDIYINYLMCLARIIYWFHPFVWYALGKMRNDREVACDAAVLKSINKDNYSDYGRTLLRCAEKLSHFSFSSVAGIGDTKKQIVIRIKNIVSFQPESRWMKAKSFLIYLSAALLVLGSTPFLTVDASSVSKSPTAQPQVHDEDLSNYFSGYKGSFVLYDMEYDKWNIYNESESRKRVSPVSTYKPYSALFALESGSISPGSTSMQWDGTTYPFESWNKNQDLDSAMGNSVNWYFQNLDSKTGSGVLGQFLNQVDYGNNDLSGGITQHWMESSLKISPFEQVEVLKDFYQNTFHYQETNIQAVKDSMYLSQANGSSLYGKTGTGTIDEQNVNGWFIGYVENDGNTYFFATHIQNEKNASGSAAAQITLNILKDKNIYLDSNLAAKNFSLPK